MAVTSEELKSILDAKLRPLHSEITNLKEQLREANSFLEFANAKYEEVLAKLEQFDKEKNLLIAENTTLERTIQVYGWSNQAITEGIKRHETVL